MVSAFIFVFIAFDLSAFVEVPIGKLVFNAVFSLATVWLLLHIL